MPFGFFRRKSDAVGAKRWRGRTPIFQHLQSDLAADRSSLPDEKRDAGSVRWAPGAMDGVMGHHASSADASAIVDRLLSHLIAWQRRPNDAKLGAIYELANDEEILSIADPLSERLPSTAGVDPARIHALARWLCTAAPDRGPVKLGMILLGSTGTAEDRDILHVLGRHDEFTLFAAVALGRCSSDWIQELWELGKHVDGWGKIHVVERLCREDDPRLRDWFIRDGFRNSIMNEYLACPCARAGRLHEALQQIEVDDPLLASAAELIEALITGGPAEDVDHYPEAAAAIAGYLRHVSDRRRPALNHCLVADRIATWLAADGVAWAERYDRGWSPEIAQECRERCASILAMQHWCEEALGLLGTGDDQRFWLASTVLERMGYPVWDVHWTRLKAKPSDSTRWYHVMRLCDAARIDEVIAFGERNLPLDEVASAPVVGLVTSGWTACLDMILQELRRFPGKGWSLIEVGLRSTHIRCRNMAMMALATWTRKHWPDGCEQALRAAHGREVDERVRLNLGRVLQGKPPK